MNFFPLRKLFRERNKWYGECSRTSPPSCTNFYWICKETLCLALSWRKTTLPFNQFTALFIDCFLSSVQLHSTSDFVERARNIPYPSHLTRYTASPSSDANRLLEWLTVTHFVLPRTFSLHIVLNNPFFIDRYHSLQELAVLLIVGAENRRWKCDQLNVYVKSWETQAS